MITAADFKDDRLTEEEQKMAENEHHLFLRYLKIHSLDKEIWYDELIEWYLQAVKKYVRIDRLQMYKFEQILFRTLDSGRGNYYRRITCKKYRPECGIMSYDNSLPDGISCLKDYITDIRVDVEILSIMKVLCEEFCYRSIHENKRIPQSIVEKELSLLIQGYERKEILQFTSNGYTSMAEKKALQEDIKHFREIFRDVFNL